MLRKFILYMMMAILVLCLVACSGNKGVDVEKQASVENTAEAAANTEEKQPEVEKKAETSEQSSNNAWPTEFSDWSIPLLSKATVTGSDNRSVSGGVVTKGINVVVNLANVTKIDFEDYCKELESKGFVKSADSLADIMLFYDKSIKGGNIKLTLTYSEGGTTIVANNSAAAENKDAAKAGDLKWPESAKEIPEFIKGEYKETVEMGGGMYALTFSGVTEADLDWYRSTLKQAGFERQESADSEGYMKLDKNAAYSVGFVFSGDILQIIVASGTY